MKITIMRLSLGAIIGIVSESAAAAPVLGAVISVVFFGFFAKHEPYAERSDNRLSITLAFSLVLFFLAALMIKVDATSDDEHDKEVFGMLLVAFLCAGPVMSAVEVFWDWLMSPKEVSQRTIIYAGDDSREARRGDSIARPPLGIPI